MGFAAAVAVLPAMAGTAWRTTAQFADACTPITPMNLKARASAWQNAERIIVRHGGRIGAEGKPDAGASFYFTLKPTATDQLANLLSNHETQTNPVGGR